MAAGFGLLALSPAAFWSMTLPELEAAIRGRLGTAATRGVPDRAAVAALMERFPDMTGDHSHD